MMIYSFPSASVSVLFSIFHLLFPSQLKASGHICRTAIDECDLLERCDGKNGEVNFQKKIIFYFIYIFGSLFFFCFPFLPNIQCPADAYKRNGQLCRNGQAYCVNGECPTLDHQCSVIWGENSRPSDLICYQQFNVQGSSRGNCGVGTNGLHLKCSEE